MGELPPAVPSPTPRPSSPPTPILPHITAPPTESSADRQVLVPDDRVARWFGILLGLAFAGSLVAVAFAGARRKRRRRR